MKVNTPRITGLRCTQMDRAVYEGKYQGEIEGNDMNNTGNFNVVNEPID